MNLPPFYIGQRVVALRNASNQIGVSIKKGQIYVVKDCIQCACGNWDIDLGLPYIGTRFSTCRQCTNILPITRAWVNAKILAPITDNFQSITLEKVLETETAETKETRTPSAKTSAKPLINEVPENQNKIIAAKILEM